MDPGTPERSAAADSTAYDGVLGQTINSNFRLIKRLGSGAMGRVFQAEQLSLGKMVAIKLMRNELMADTDLLKRFEFEARAAAALNHPNVIQIIDYGRDRDFLFIAMELLAGIDLGQHLNSEGPIPLHRAAYIMDQVLSALDEAHSQGIVHRDLKPGNIMLIPRRGETTFVKVLDFGIAKAAGRESRNATVAGLVFGTPEYMSPEQARGLEVDGRTDLYAVATMLYQLIVGEVPFAAELPVDVMVRQISELPIAPSKRGDLHIPPALDDLVMRGLAKKPADRPQTAAEFQVQLRQALASVVPRWPGNSGTLGLSMLSPSSVPSAALGSTAAIVVPPAAGAPAASEGTAPATPPAAYPVARRRWARAVAVVTVIFLALGAGATAYVARRTALMAGVPRRAPPPVASRALARPSMLARPPASAPPVDDEATTEEEPPPGAEPPSALRAGEPARARASSVRRLSGRLHGAGKTRAAYYPLHSTDAQEASSSFGSGDGDGRAADSR